MPSPSTLKAMRVLHHYSGVFIAPAVLFFSITGALQTFSLHETTRGSSYVPPAILVHLSQLHKKATIVVPVRKPAPPAPKAAAAPAPATAAPTAPAVPKPPDAPPPPSHLPMKIFFLLVSVGLVLSTLTGLGMAWIYNRNKLAVALTFLAGLALPCLLLLF